MAEAIAGDEVLFLVSDSRSLAQMRMQSLLFGMHWLRRHLLPLPAATQGPPCCAGVRTLKSLELSLSLSLTLSPAAPETSGLREKAVLLTDLLMFFLTKTCVCLWRRAADSTFVVPRCDSSLGDSEGAGYHRRPDLHHQQRARGVSE